MSKYRILRHSSGLYYPQYRGWFLWHFFPETDSNGGGNVHHTTLEGATNFVTAVRDYDRRMAAAEPQRYRTVMEFEE